jgi:putative ABC transport system ATP-binding protein
MENAVAIENLTFAYRGGPMVLDIPTLSIPRGERVFLYGPSGSGKTTLLGILAGVLDAGGSNGGRTRVEVLGRDLSTLSGSRRDAFRAEHLGYIFQMFNLIPYLTVLDNIALPCRINRARRERLGGEPLEDAAAAMARRLGLGEFIGKPVTQLSVGQQQRVAAARALLGSPGLIVADEPTSALDANRRESFLSLLFDCCREAEATLVFVSHDERLMDLFDRGLSLPEINAASRVEG